MAGLRVLELIYGKESKRNDERQLAVKGSFSSHASWTGRLSTVCLVVFFVVAELIILRSEAATAEESLLFNTRSQVVRVGLFTCPGYHNFDESGIKDGYGYDYIELLRRFTSWKYEFSDPQSDWNDLLRLLDEGKIDLVTGMEKTPELEEKYAFSRNPIGQFSSVLAIKSGNSRLLTEDYADWDGIRVGMRKNSARNAGFDQFAREKGFTYVPVYYDNNALLQESLQTGKDVDVVVCSSLQRLENAWIIERFDPAPFYIVVRKSDRKLLEELNSAMILLETQSPNLQSILWHRYYAKNGDEEVAYSPQERAFIEKMRASGRTIKAVLSPDRKPLSWFENGKYHGIQKDLADEIIRRTGLNIQFVPTHTLTEYRDACLNPDIDIIFDCVFDFRQATQESLVLSDPYINTFLSVLSNRNRAGGLHKVAILHDYSSVNVVKSYFQRDVTFDLCNSTQEAIQLMRQGKCDAVCLHTCVVESIVFNDAKAELLSNQLASSLIRYSIGIRESRNLLLPAILNKAVLSLNDSVVNQIISGYDPIVNSPYSLKRLASNRPGLFIGLPFCILLLFCALLIYLLHARKKEYRTGVVFGSLPIRHLVADEQGNVLQHNLGDSNYPLRGTLSTLSQIPFEETGRIMRDSIATVLRTGVSTTVVYEEAGGMRTAVISRLPDSCFNKPAAIWISQDMTELQKSREKAQQNEEFCRMTLNSIGDGVIATDVQGRVILLNPVAEHMIGIKLEDAIGKPHEQVFKIVSAYDNTILESPVFRTLRTGVIVELANHTDLLSLDGTRRYHIADSAAPIHDASGKIAGAILVFRDVTEEYRRRRANQLELANWTIAADMAQIHTFRFNCVTRIIHGSGDFKRIWPTCDGKAIPSEEWILPEDLVLLRKESQEILTGRKEQANLQYRVHDGDCTRHFRIFMRRSTEEPNEVSGIVQEITEFVRTRDKQNSIQSLWTTVVNALPAMLFVKSATNDFRYKQCNDRFATWLNRTQMEIVGQNDAELFEKPDEAAWFLNWDKRIMAGGKPVEFHEDVKGADQILRHIRTVKLPSTDEDGNPILIGISLDETEDYLRSVELQNLLENWEIATELAGIVTFRMNCKTREVSGSRRFPEYWPVRDGKVLFEEEFIHPDDLAATKAHFADVIDGRVEHVVCDYRTLANGKIRYFKSFLRRKPQDDSIWGVLQDITEATEERLKHESTRLLWETISNAIPAILYVKDAEDDFRILQVNHRFLEFVGVTADEAIGKTDSELYQGTPNVEIFLQEDQDALKMGKMVEFYENARSAKGELRRFQTIKIPFTQPDGHRILIGMSVDVTDLQELAETRELVSSAFELLFATEDEEKSIRTVFERIGAYIGADRSYVCCVDHDSHMTRCFAELIPDGEQSLFAEDIPLTHEEETAWFQKTQEAEPSFSCDFENETDRKFARLYAPSMFAEYKRLNIRSLHVNFIAIAGKIWGKVGFASSTAKMKSLSDVEKNLLRMMGHVIELMIVRRSVRRKLEIALQDAQAAAKAKSFFIANVSHEIRTPLNAVIGFAELLKDGQVRPEEVEEYLANIVYSGNVLLQLINDVLDLSSLEAGQIRLVNAPVDFETFGKEVLRVFSQSNSQANFVLQAEIPPMPALELDRLRIRQILFNLLGNAVKFTLNGSVTLWANFEPDSDTEGTFRFGVTDTGIGIAPDEQHKLMEPFVQVGQLFGMDTSRKGAGLGLSICKRLAERMGGELKLESELGLGSTFSVVLPHTAYTWEGGTKEKDGFEPVDSSTPSTMSVLLVDDVPLNLTVLKAMFVKLRFENLFCATSGQEALEMLNQRHFDLVLTDMWMPKMNGEELAQKIHSLPDYATLPVVAVTADVEFQGNFSLNHFSGILLKPVTLAKIQKILADVSKPTESS